MRPLLSFIARGRVSALLCATAVAMLSVVVAGLATIVPLLLVAVLGLYLASAAIVGLVTLRQGAREGLLVMLGPAAFWLLPVLVAAEMGVPGWLLLLPALGAIVGVYLPIIAMSWGLRTSRSQGFMLAIGVAMVACGLVALELSGFHPTVELARSLLPILRTSQQQEWGPDWDRLEAQLTELPEPSVIGAVVGGMQAGNLLATLTLIAFVSRWWHAILDNPGGFGEEFRALRVDRRMALLAAALLAVSMLASAASGEGAVGDRIGLFAVSLLVVVLVPFLFQGIAVAHTHARRRSSGRGLLVAMYLMLVLPGVSGLMVFGITAVGIADAWVDLRSGGGQTT